MIQCVCVFYMQYQSESWFNSGEGDPPLLYETQTQYKTGSGFKKLSIVSLAM